MLHLDPARTQAILWANTRNKAAIVRWRNGASAMLDLRNSRSLAWFEDQLDYLVEECGVDGFKFDAGDAGFYQQGIFLFNETISNDHSMHFGRLGLKYPLNEYRACSKWQVSHWRSAYGIKDIGGMICVS
jgi:alpha-glucosidase (family GH31 glycosyl hydrolase)